jgi:succinoglycan biosynthesis protein ExoM
VITAVSICICTYRRASLQRTLESVAAQSLPAGVSSEIVVVDNDALSSARAVVEQFARSVPVRVSYAVEPRKGLSAARNRTLELGTGEWLAFIDDDEIADADWLMRLVACAQVSGADAVVGTVLPKFEQTPPPWVRESKFFDLWLPPTGTRIGMGEALLGNALVRASFVHDKGLRFDPAFDATGGEDTDFFGRFVRAGGVVVSSREAIVHELVPPERMSKRYLTARSLRAGEVHARVTHRQGGARALATGMARAAFNVAAATVIAVAAAPLGRGISYRYYLALTRNIGKFRYYFGIPQIEMYR